MRGHYWGEREQSDVAKNAQFAPLVQYNDHMPWCVYAQIEMWRSVIEAHSEDQGSGGDHMEEGNEILWVQITTFIHPAPHLTLHAMTTPLTNATNTYTNDGT